jgi:beta-glucosidase/6-phospho-beta-glucosidase/beta-galactosidase
VEVSEGVFDEEALAHYWNVAECIRGHGMKVMLTLHHFVWPVWLERDRGGMVGKKFPELFARYADRLAVVLGDVVDFWITFNEPSQLTFGYIKPWWQSRYFMPSGLPRGSDVDADAEAVGKLVSGIFRAHARARVEIQARRPEAMVGVNPLVTGFPAWETSRCLGSGICRGLARRSCLQTMTKRETRCGRVKWARCMVMRFSWCRRIRRVARTCGFWSRA